MLGFEKTYTLPFKFDIPNYPPYNIRKIDKDKYQLEMALAGFLKDDIEVEVKENTLTVSVKPSNKKEESFVHRGIAQRAFKRQWTLIEHLEVKNAQFKDGILIIDMNSFIWVLEHFLHAH